MQAEYMCNTGSVRNNMRWSEGYEFKSQDRPSSPDIYCHHCELTRTWGSLWSWLQWENILFFHLHRHLFLPESFKCQKKEKVRQEWRKRRSIIWIMSVSAAGPFLQPPVPRGKIPYNLPHHDDTHRSRHSRGWGGGRPHLLTFHSTYRFIPYGFSFIPLFISFNSLWWYKVSF